MTKRQNINNIRLILGDNTKIVYRKQCKEKLQILNSVLITEAANMEENVYPQNGPYIEVCL